MKDTSSNSNTESLSSEGLTPRRLLQRSALPFFLFACALTGMLGVSRIAILPQLTSVEVEGIRRDPAALQEYVVALEQTILSAEQRRDALILPAQQSRYRSFLDEKHAMPSLWQMSEAVHAAARATVPDHPAAVRIDRVQLSAEDRMLILSGIVRDVGPQSMTVLAQFTETIRSFSFAADIRPPRFVRLEDPVIGFHSPFTIIILLEDPVVSP